MSPDINLERRRFLADLIRSNRSGISERVTDEFLARHPSWLEQYGELVRRSGVEDAGFHQDFLAAAIEANEVDAFTSYLRWSARTLASRGSSATFLVENVEQIGAAIRDIAPAGDYPIIDPFIQAGVASCLNAGLCANDIGADTGSLAFLYVEAALRGQRQAAIHLLLEAVKQDYTLPKLYADVLQPAMYRIGALWQMNKITIAQEHTATVITQYAMARLYPLIERPHPARGNVLITGVEGEQHQVGANMVADMLELDGWDVRFLGTNTPASAVVAAVDDHQANVVGISATMLFNLPRVGQLVERLQTANTGSPMKIIVGGAAFRCAPNFYKDIGAHACALDLESAVAAVNHIMAPGGLPGDVSCNTQHTARIPPLGMDRDRIVQAVRSEDGTCRTCGEWET